MLLGFESTKRGFYSDMTRIALAGVHRERDTHDDRFLVDNGFSRKLPEQGVRAWPRWATDKATNAAV